MRRKNWQVTELLINVESAGLAEESLKRVIQPIGGQPFPFADSQGGTPTLGSGDKQSVDIFSCFRGLERPGTSRRRHTSSDIVYRSPMQQRSRYF